MTSHPEADSAEAAFYRAFEHCDLNAMSHVWDDSEQSSCIHPGGPLLQGTHAVLDSWGEIFSQARPPQVHYRVLQRLQCEGMAIHTVEEAIRPSDSEAEPTRLIATNIYRHTDQGWRMLAHHACLPVMGQRTAPRGAVH